MLVGLESHRRSGFLAHTKPNVVLIWIRMYGLKSRLILVRLETHRRSGFLTRTKPSVVLIWIRKYGLKSRLMLVGLESPSYSYSR